VGDHETQEFSASNPKGAFFKIEAHVILENLFEHLCQICHMFGHAMRLDDHVIHIDLDILSYLLFEDPVHKPLLYGSYILEVGRTIHKLFDDGKGICILGVCLVDASVLSAHMPFPIGLLYHDDVGQPGRVPDLYNAMKFR